jgi:hypothetical protein
MKVKSRPERISECAVIVVQDMMEILQGFRKTSRKVWAIRRHGKCSKIECK